MLKNNVELAIEVLKDISKNIENKHPAYDNVFRINGMIKFCLILLSCEENVSSDNKSNQTDKNINIDEAFEIILVCAERYALGRQTYVVKDVINYITPLLSKLSIQTLKTIERDLANAYSYGDEKIDKPIWIKLLKNVKNELNKRFGGDKLNEV